MKITFFSSAIIVIISILVPLESWSQYEKLDSVIRIMDKTIELKENKIGELKLLSNITGEEERNLELLEMIFEEYRHYDYDSALFYLDRIYQLAEVLNNEDAKAASLINLALINTDNGNYEVSDLILEEIDPDDLNYDNYNLYNKARYLLNISRKTEVIDNESQSEYQNFINESITEYIDNIDKNTTDYYYLIAEKLKYVENKPDSALNYYKRVFEKSPDSSELYWATAYKIAEYYKNIGEKLLYKEWLIKAATAEAKASMKERRALEDLAIYIFQEEPEDVKRATGYMLLASGDAINYNSSNRIKGLTEKMPEFLPMYLGEINAERSNFILALLLMIILIGVLAALMVYLNRQKLHIFDNRTVIHTKEAELETLKSQLSKSQERLETVNRILVSNERRLNTIHIKRENLAKVWIDICDAQVTNIKTFRKKLLSNLSAKIDRYESKDKENILKEIPKYKIDEIDAQKFLKRFDLTFLDLYPNFPDEINKLLKENNEIILINPNVLTTELRICALIRMGIKESSEMANLLFASTQTIYNNRTKLRNKAKDKERFEDQIMSIYPV